MEPETIVVRVIGMVAFALAAYLLLLIVVAAVSRILGAPHALRAITPAMLRPFVGMIAGASLSVPMAAVAQTTSTSPPVVMHRVTDRPAPTPAPAPASAPAVRTHVVVPGEHFWSIAESVLHDAWGRNASVPEVTPYWRALVEANRDRLRDPHNADLVFPGQEFVVPAPPAAGLPPTY